MVDWIVLYLVSRGATSRVQSVRIPGKKAGDAAAHAHTLAVNASRSLSLSHSLSRSLSLAPRLRSLVFRDSPTGPAHSASVYPAS